MKKKILALCLVIALAITAVTGATLAYFTDTDSAENVFTVGNVDIDLREWLDQPEGTPFEDVDNVMPGEQYTKIVDVKNIGKNDAYVRVTIVIPEDMTPVWNDDAIGTDKEWTLASTETAADGSTTYVYTRNSALAPDAVSSAILTAVQLNGDVTELTMKDSYKVLVNAEAIQADGLTAEEAYKALDDATMVAKRTEAANVDEVNAALADTEAQVVTLTGNIKSTAKIVMQNTDSVLDGSGNAITKDASAEATKINAGVRTNGGTIKNVTITGNKNANDKGFRAIYVEGGLKNDLTIENADLSGLYPLSISGGSKGYSLTVKDSKLNGWTSFATVDSATFTGVDFGEAEGYKYFVPYSSVTVTNCTFVEGFGMAAGNEGITIELNNCKVGETDVTAANIATLFALDESVKACTVVVNGETVTF